MMRCLSLKSLFDAIGRLAAVVRRGVEAMKCNEQIQGYDSIGLSGCSVTVLQMEY